MLFTLATVTMANLPRCELMRDGLGVGVADDADAGIALELGESRFEFGAEVGTFQIVNRAHEAHALGVCGHTATLRSHM